MALDPTGIFSHNYRQHRGISWKEHVRCATTGNITIATGLNAGDTIDGVTLAAGTRVLVKDQSTPTQNGIYIAGATPVRAADMDQDLTTAVPAEEIAGAFVYVAEGTVNAGTLWHTTNPNGDTIGSDNIVWEQFSGSGGGGSSSVYTVEPQTPHQARVYLMRDGTWRDPLITGLGTITAGSPSTVTDDTKYNAWPTLARLTENRVILAYTKADSHHADNTGKAVVRIGTEDGDGTVSWGSEITAYDDPSLWSSAFGVARISTGRVFLTLWRDNASSSGTGEAGIVYSDDDGATWTDWIDLTNSFTQESYGAGPVVELPDGDLLVTIEGSNTGQAIANRSSHTLRSTDQGVTWGGEVTVRNYVTDTRPYYESRLLLLDNDVLQCHHRTSAGSPGTHYVSTSTDFGMTWGTPVTTVAGYGAPNVIQASTGTLFFVTRENSTADVIVYTSTDRGATWDSGTVVFSTTEMEYGCPLESLLTGEVFVAYGDQPTGSTTNSDIDMLTVTEDLTTFAGAIPDHDHSADTTEGGDTLSPAVLNLPTANSPAQTANGQVVWDSDDDVLTVGTGAARRTIGYVGSTTPIIESGSGSAGSSNETSRADHVHPISSSSGIGEILISDTPSTPLVFADLIQNEAQDDLVYADP